jgi:hypothetical protein
MSMLPGAKKPTSTKMPTMPSMGNRPMPTQHKNIKAIGTMNPAGRPGKVTVGGSGSRKR